MEIVAILSAMGKKASPARDAVLASFGNLIGGTRTRQEERGPGTLQPMAPEAEQDVDLELRRAWVPMWVEALWEMGTPLSRIREELPHLPNAKSGILAEAEEVISSLYQVPLRQTGAVFSEEGGSEDYEAES
jgi:hypothetical protein